MMQLCLHTQPATTIEYRGDGGKRRMMQFVVQLIAMYRPRVHVFQGRSDYHY